MWTILKDKTEEKPTQAISHVACISFEHISVVGLIITVLSCFDLCTINTTDAPQHQRNITVVPT